MRVPLYQRRLRCEEGYRVPKRVPLYQRGFLCIKEGSVEKRVTVHHRVFRCTKEGSVAPRRVVKLVTWCFEPSQPPRSTSELSFVVKRVPLYQSGLRYIKELRLHCTKVGSAMKRVPLYQMSSIVPKTVTVHQRRLHQVLKTSLAAEFWTFCSVLRS